MRSLLFVCTAALLLWGDVAGEKPCSDKPVSTRSPKSDEPVETRARKPGYIEWVKLPGVSPNQLLYYESRLNQTRQSIENYSKRIPELRDRYQRAKKKYTIVAVNMDKWNRRLLNATLDLKKAEQLADFTCENGDNILPPENNRGFDFKKRYILLLTNIRDYIDKELSRIQ